MLVTATPLHVAAGGGYWEIVQELVAAGANPNSRMAGGETPLCCATDGWKSGGGLRAPPRESGPSTDYHIWVPRMTFYAEGSRESRTGLTRAKRRNSAYSENSTIRGTLHLYAPLQVERR